MFEISKTKYETIINHTRHGWALNEGYDDDDEDDKTAGYDDRRFKEARLNFATWPMTSLVGAKK